MPAHVWAGPDIAASNRFQTTRSGTQKLDLASTQALVMLFQRRYAYDTGTSPSLFPELWLVPRILRSTLMQTSP